jgi:hypothetical protein
MSRTFRGLAAGAAAVLAFTGISLTVSGTANADQDECLQILDNGNHDGNGNGDENGDDNEENNGYEEACEKGADGRFDECLTQLMFDEGVGPIDATEACAAAIEDGDNGGDQAQS